MSIQNIIYDVEKVDLIYSCVQNRIFESIKIIFVSKGTISF